MANTKLTRTFGTATSRTTGTFSFWIKASSFTGGLFDNYSDNSNRSIFYFGSNKFKFYDAVAGVEYNVADRVIKDCNGWYHVVLMINTSDGTQADRVRIYINGERQTLSGSQDYNQNENSYMFNPSTTFTIGNDSTGSDYFNGAISHFHYCDGQAYDASSFGSTDSTTGEWKINTSPSVTYGNQGFFILKDGNSVTDSSSNSNAFSVASGTLTKTEDSPSNVFATWNPLFKPWSGDTTYTYGNTRLYNSHSTHGASATTLGATSGKYYMEMRQENANNIFVGVCGEGFVSDDINNKYSGNTEDATTGLFIYKSNGRKVVNGAGTNSYFTTYGSGDIIGIALDLDASTRTVTFYKNGVADSAGTQNLPTNMQTGYVFGAGITWSGSAIQLNAGNGYFANNAISSAGTNASGNGLFEYNIQPTDATALSTKGLNL